MKHTQINQIEKLNRVIDRGSFKFNQLCDANTVLALVGLMKKHEVEEQTEGDYAEMEKLAKAAVGKKSSSVEVISFQASCSTKKIKHWCEQALDIYKKSLELKESAENVAAGA